MRATAMEGACGPVIDSGDEQRAEEIGLRGRRQLAAQHQPDHGREADMADEILHGIATEADTAGRDIDNGGLPPILHVFDAERLFGLAHG